MPNGACYQSRNLFCSQEACLKEMFDMLVKNKSAFHAPPRTISFANASFVPRRAHLRSNIFLLCACALCRAEHICITTFSSCARVHIYFLYHRKCKAVSYDIKTIPVITRTVFHKFTQRAILSLAYILPPFS